MSDDDRLEDDDTGEVSVRVMRATTGEGDPPIRAAPDGPSEPPAGDPIALPGVGRGQRRVRRRRPRP